MKSNSLTYFAAIGLALTFVGTGCKHKPVGVTNIPERPSGQIGDPNAKPIEDSGRVKPEGEGETRPLLPRGLEELDRVAIRIEQLDLPAARPDLHVISEREAGAPQLGDSRGKIVHTEYDAIRPA